MSEQNPRLADAIARATAAMTAKWERERSEEPEPLYDFTYHVEFGGGKKLGLKLRADYDTGLWAKSFLEGWPSSGVVFGFEPAGTADGR